jgi:hypothetical protein
MKIESKVPKRITVEHLGVKILYRLPNNALAFEGVIDELSLEEDYIHVKNRWIPNDGTAILAVLSAPQRRRDMIG